MGFVWVCIAYSSNFAIFTTICLDFTFASITNSKLGRVNLDYYFRLNSFSLGLFAQQAKRIGCWPCP